MKTLKNNQNLSQLPTTWKGATDFFLLSYFEYCQIWLNILMVDCHFSNITKLENETLSQSASFSDGVEQAIFPITA